MPNTSTPSINNDVAIGRRMKGSEMLIGNHLRIVLESPYQVRAWRGRRCSTGSARRLRVQQLDAGTFGQPVLAVDHHPLAGGQPLGDGGNTVLDRSHVDDAALDRVVGLDHIDVIAVRPF